MAALSAVADNIGGLGVAFHFATRDALAQARNTLAHDVPFAFTFSPAALNTMAANGIVMPPHVAQPKVNTRLIISYSRS